MVEVLWKTVFSVLNRQLTTTIELHDVLHGFWMGQGVGTADLEATLLQQISAMREAVLFKILLDLQKAYDDLDRDRCLDNLATYRVSPRTIQLLWTYWDRLTNVAGAGG